MQTKESLISYDMMNEEQAKEALQLAVSLVEGNVDEFTDCFPDSNSQDNFYPKSENIEWTTGFWTGEIWLAYEYTEKEKFRQAAENQIDSFLKRIEEKIAVDHHDMGFLYSPPAWRAIR